MKFVNTICLSIAIALIGSFAVAQESTSEEKACCGGCAVTKAMKNLPAMTYKVGDKDICCSESASAMAKKEDKPMHYVVGKKEFTDKTEAYTALVESTEKFVNEFITPCKCEASGTTTIAGASCSCPVEAGQKSEMVKKAVAEVKMTYVVGKEKCQCPTKAKDLAAKSDEKTTYVVAGKETCCNLEARLNLAKAKYAAAVKALAAKAEEKTETVSTDS